tara:strand:+ start:873 stop:1979 length:1107 start_codon:yes stop_codon:yes gene_type:complete
MLNTVHYKPLMRVDLFDFNLPVKNIAQYPVEPRDTAKLLHVGKNLRDLTVGDLPEILHAGDLIVVNDTKVLPCRLTGIRHSKVQSKLRKISVRVEVTLHKSKTPDTWLAFVRPARKLAIGDIIIFSPKFRATVRDKNNGGEIELQFNLGGITLLDQLEVCGVIPLPPYIKRNDPGVYNDADSYQTLFASELGAVAAPTAGLHFTPTLIDRLQNKGISISRVTLHVGAGTFLPVKVDDTRKHPMHGELGVLSDKTAETVNATRRSGGRVLAVGSTSMRLLESAADKLGEVQPFHGETNLFITPGYRFKVVNLMLTNFHLPRSTLFMLVAAFSGLDRMKKAYAYAIEKEYRFYSYGDACLLEPAFETWRN